MIAALVYLQVTSLGNAVLSNLRRLRQPKYFLGAIAGGAYLYYFVLLHAFSPRAGLPFTAAKIEPEALAALASLLAILLLVGAGISWSFPAARAALGFTEAEVAFLFTAPFSRAALIHFKLIRLLLMTLLSAAILSLFSNRMSATGAPRWTMLVGWWVLFSTMRLHVIGASFARSILLKYGLSHARRRAILLTLAGAMAVYVGWWMRNHFAAPSDLDLASLEASARYIDRVLSAGPLHWVLMPFRWTSAVLFAPDLPAFLRALGPALAVMAMHYLWILHADVAFEEASIEAARQAAERVALLRSGNWRVFRGARRVVAAPFRLGGTGPVALAFLWKNLISAGALFHPRRWAVGAVLLGAACLWLSRHPEWRGFQMSVGVIASVLMGYVLFLGPQMARQDLRADLVNADLLKSYPLEGWQVVLGSLLTPIAILTAMEWILLMAAGLCVTGSGRRAFDPALRSAVIASLALLLPVFLAILLLLQNAVALLFPSLVQMMQAGTRGVEMLGQRLLFMVAYLFAFVVLLVPAALVGAVASTLAFWLGGLPLAIFASAFAGGGVLLLELVLGVWLVGWWFDRFDLSTELLRS